MEVGARHGNGGMSKGLLYKVDGSTTVEGMAGMGVPEPMRTDGLADARHLACRFDNTEYLFAAHCPALSAPKHRGILCGILAKGHDMGPN